MNITYTGKQEHLHPAQKTSLDTKLAKIGKLLEEDGKGEKRAHFMLNQHKNEHRAGITINFLDHQLIGEHADPDQFTAMNLALDKLEKQMLKVRDKRRDIKKIPRDKSAAQDEEPGAISGAEAVSAKTNGKPKVYRVAPADSKPMTLEEAILVIDSDSYLVYRDANTNQLSVLLHRDDGHFDLVEC